MRSLGREYLRAVPAEASPVVLTVRVAERLPGGLGAVDTAADGRLRELLLRAMADDPAGGVLDPHLLRGYAA